MAGPDCCVMQADLKGAWRLAITPSLELTDEGQSSQAQAYSLSRRVPPFVSTYAFSFSHLHLSTTFGVIVFASA